MLIMSSVGEPVAKVYRGADRRRVNPRLLQDKLSPLGKAWQDQSSRFGTVISNKDINGAKKTIT